MSEPKFVRDDTVRLVKEDQIGTVQEVRHSDTGHRYTIELREEVGQHIEVPEADLELEKAANADETGFHIRYIS